MDKACTVILRFDRSRNAQSYDLDSTVLSDVKCLFVIIEHPCIPGAGFEAIFD